MSTFKIQGNKSTIDALAAVEAINVNVTLGADVAEDVEGKKVIKAGTPIGGFLGKYNQKGKKATGAEDVEGLVWYDVTVTSDKKEVSVPVMIQGWVNTDLIDTAVVTEEMQKALPLIGFIANGKGGRK